MRIKGFPDDQEERMARILPSVSTELGQIILGLLLSDEYKTANDLEKDLELYTDWTRVWGGRNGPHGSTLKSYNECIFVPRGLVIEGKIKRKWIKPVTAYKLTEAGYLGALVARYSLKTAVDMGLSFSQIFGRVSSSSSREESRAPYNRAMIMLELEKKENQRIKDLSNRIMLNLTGLTYHLNALRKIGSHKI